MSCEIDNDNGEYPSCFKQKDRKARKSHTCSECNKTIEAGETYHYESGVWDGTPQDFKICNDCISVRNTFFCSFMYHQLWEDVKEMIIQYNGQISESKINLLTQPAKEKILSLIEELIEEE